MKKLKLMALGLMFLMVQSAVAVTLPSTSYTPYGGGGESSEVVFSSGSMITGSYLQLGDTGCEGQKENCESCCYTALGIEACEEKCTTQQCVDECSAGLPSCINACEGGGSLPLDGGLSILLVLALGSGVFRAVRVLRKK